MTAKLPLPWPHIVPYLPVQDAARPAQQPLPDYVRPHVPRTGVLTVPESFEHETAHSILRLYISDLEWVILPEAHRDRDGYTFTNVSYYSTDDVPRALSQPVGDVCRSQLSRGMVRQMAALAHATWCTVVPLMVPSRPAPALVAPVSDLRAVMRGDFPLPDDSYEAIIRRYPRIMGQNPDLTTGGYESEFLLFADMLRFAWCHEWFHGLAGHLTLLRDRYGVAEMGEAGSRTRVPADIALLRRALEFQADVLSVDLIIDQIMMGEDLPTNLIEAQFTLGERLGLLALAFCAMTAYWAQQELHLGLKDRVHPPIAVRYLRLWDMLRFRLTMIGDAGALADATAVGHTIAVLGERVPAFWSFAEVNPVVLETPGMRRLRATMREYQAVLADQLGAVRPFLLDHSFRDAYPVVGHPGDEGDGTTPESAQRRIDAMAYWVNIPDPDKVRVACHFPSLFTDEAADILTNLTSVYRTMGDDAPVRQLERAAKLLADLRRIGLYDLTTYVQLAGITGSGQVARRRARSTMSWAWCEAEAAPAGRGRFS